MINSSHDQLTFGMVFLTETHKPSRVTVYDVIVYLPPRVCFLNAGSPKLERERPEFKIRRSQENSEKKERKRRQSQEKHSLL